MWDAFRGRARLYSIFVIRQTLTKTNKKAVLWQGNRTHDAVVKFDTYRNVQRHRAVLSAIARLSCCYPPDTDRCPSVCPRKDSQIDSLKIEKEKKTTTNVLWIRNWRTLPDDTRCMCTYQAAALFCVKWCHGRRLESVTSNRKCDSVNRCVFTRRTILLNFIPMWFEMTEP